MTASWNTEKILEKLLKFTLHLHQNMSQAVGDVKSKWPGHGSNAKKLPNPVTSLMTQKQDKICEIED